MNLADAAAHVLEQEGGQSLSPREIAERAVAAGLIAPRSSAPWTYVAAAVRKENRRMTAGGLAPRFSVADGRISLVRS
jgi:hypothetical protein